MGVPLPGAAVPAPARTRISPVTWQIPGQLALFQIPRDLTRFHRPTHANPANPMLIHARAAARKITQARGWSHHLLDEVDDALVVLLSGYAPGDWISHSEICQVDRLGLNVSRTAEVIDHLGVLNDDRQDAFDAWLDRKLADLAPRIATDVRAWANTLRHGGQRSKPRSPQTIRNYLNAMHPQLRAWSACYETLRETTPADVHTATDALTGLPRKRTAVGLRSLFRFLRRTNRIFQDPTRRLKTGNPALPALCPLPPATLSRAAGMVTTPAARLILALAAIHVARPITLRRLQLEDVDLPNRRITINGHTRRLDELTARLLADYLEDRNRRWPHTLNTHLFVSEQTGHDHRPVGEWWISTRLEGIAATPNQIRMDRQLEEAMAYGPDALHLASVFGISERAAIRYADAARQLLEAGPFWHG
ncbi:predicted protein [Streptomyces sp. C]|nr:predicted protein [Streptomyces sp. C]